MSLNPFQSLFEWTPAGSSLRVPLLASVSVGIPVILGILFQQPRMAMVAATGAMVILYMPHPARSLCCAMKRMLACSAGFVICYALASATTFHPIVAAAAIAVLAMVATTICRCYDVPAPRSFFFILVACIASNATFNLAEIPLRALLMAGGCLVSCGVAALYLLLRKQRIKKPAALPEPLRPRMGAILIEAFIIGLFVGIAMAVARLFHLQNPYWVPISCAAILQGGTFRAVWQRNIHRIAGTAIGMVLWWSLLPWVRDPTTMAVTIILLVFAVQHLVRRHYGLAIIFVTPLTVAYAEYASGSAAVHGLLTLRLANIVFGSLIGAFGGWVLYHPSWWLPVEQRLNRLFGWPRRQAVFDCSPRP